MQILLSVNSMLDVCEITETKEIGACEVLRAQELTHTQYPLKRGRTFERERERGQQGKISNALLKVESYMQATMSNNPPSFYSALRAWCYCTTLMANLSAHLYFDLFQCFPDLTLFITVVDEEPAKTPRLRFNFCTCTPWRPVPLGLRRFCVANLKKSRRIPAFLMLSSSKKLRKSGRIYVRFQACR